MIWPFQLTIPNAALWMVLAMVTVTALNWTAEIIARAKMDITGVLICVLKNTGSPLMHFVQMQGWWQCGVSVVRNGTAWHQIKQNRTKCRDTSLVIMNYDHRTIQDGVSHSYNCIFKMYVYNMKQARPWMLAKLKIICQFHAHPVHQNSVEIFWTDIYRGRLFYGRI